VSDVPETIVVSERVLYLDGAPVPTRYPVVAACHTDGHVIVLYDSAADARRWGTFRNLASVSADGAERWLADTAETTTGDHFTGIKSCDPRGAFAFSGYDCRLDPKTGRIVEKVFTK
jgi:hypothetical protein